MYIKKMIYTFISRIIVVKIYFERYRDEKVLLSNNSFNFNIG